MCLKLNLNSILIYNKEEVNKSNLIKPSLKDIASSVLLDDKSSDIDTLSNFNPKKTGDSYFLPVKTSFGGFFNREQLKTNEVVKKEIKQEAIAIPKVIEISSTNKYNLTEKRGLKDGVEALQYEGTGNKKATLRAYIIDPKKANISVNYKQGGENIHNFLKDKNISVVTNGTFMNNYLPQGNIIGENLKNKAQGIYQLEGNDSAANGRAFFAIKKDGTLEIKKGGKIDSNTIQAYSSLISGLPILSDKDHNSFKDKDAFLENLKVEYLLFLNEKKLQ